MSICYGCNKCNECGRFDGMMQAAHVRRCPKCGIVVERDDAAACPECGTPVAPALPKPPGVS